MQVVASVVGRDRWVRGGHADYAKFGYNNWNSFSGSRKVLLRSPVLVADPTGKYGPNDLRAFVQAH
jgi:hypothetical protein